MKNQNQTTNFELPLKHDCIATGDYIGIVQEVSSNSLILGVSVEENNLLRKSITVSQEGWRRATDSEERKLQNRLYENGLSWSRYHNNLIETKEFKENNFVRITRLGKRLGLGIFKGIINNELTLFVYMEQQDGENNLYYDSLNVILGNPEDYQLESLTAEERYELVDILKSNAMEWNGHYSRLQPISWRAKQGERYYYISDQFDTVAAFDNNTPKHLKRYRSYNYFRNKEDAEEIIKMVIERRKQQLLTSHFPVPKRKYTKRKS